MDFVTVGKLRTESAKVWGKLAAGEEMVIMRKGKPFAILVQTQPAEVESNPTISCSMRCSRARFTAGGLGFGSNPQPAAMAVAA